MSRNNTLLAGILLFGIGTFSLHAQEQSEKIWVTFESNSDIPELVDGKLHSSNLSVQNLIEEFAIVHVEQALPSSSQEKLRKVYEVTCNCNATELSQVIVNRSTALTKPESAPDYQLLYTPDDYTTAFPDDYALNLINAEGAWEYSTGDESTIIGISDANYYQLHEDLEGKIAYINPSNYSTNYYHGTAVAITAAGDTDNGVGKSSIGFNCKLNLNTMSYNNLIQMSNQGIRVINVSWASGCSPNEYVQDVIDEIYENGSIIVAAAGNGTTCGGPENFVFPAACEHVISVSSIGPDDNHERVIGDPNTTHQHNVTVDICAPGYDVPLSIFPGYYNCSSGTSFAAPIVSGTIGLMISLKPCLTFEEVLEILTASADDIYTLNPTYTNLLGAGRLNAEQALYLTSINYCNGVTNPPITVDPFVLDGTSVNVTINDTSTGNGGTIDPTLTSHENIENDLFLENSSSASIESATEMAVSVYPNPTAGLAIIELEITEEMELTVMDTRGSIVSNQLLQTGANKTQINLTQSGVYFLKITKNGAPLWFGKLVKT